MGKQLARKGIVMQWQHNQRPTPKRIRLRLWFRSSEPNRPIPMRLLLPGTRSASICPLCPRVLQLALSLCTWEMGQKEIFYGHRTLHINHFQLAFWDNCPKTQFQLTPAHVNPPEYARPRAQQSATSRDFTPFHGFRPQLCTSCVAPNSA